MHQGQEVSLVYGKLEQICPSVVQKKAYDYVTITAQKVKHSQAKLCTFCSYVTCTIFIHRKSFSMQEWGAAEVNSAMKKAAECNNAKKLHIGYFWLGERDLREVLEEARGCLWENCGFKSSDTGNSNGGIW